MEAVLNFIKSIDWGLVFGLMLLITCLIILFIEVMRARKHGLGFTIGTLLMLIVSIILAIVTTRILSLVLGGNLVNLLQTSLQDVYNMIAENAPNAPELLAVFVAIFTGPLIFVILFFLYRIILQFFAKLIRMPFERLITKKEKEVIANREEKKQENMVSTENVSAAENVEGEPGSASSEEYDPASEDVVKHLTEENMDDEFKKQAGEDDDEKFKPLGPKERPILTTAIAMVLGAVCGLLLIIATFSPRVGYSRAGEEVMPGVTAMAKEVASTASNSQSQPEGEATADYEGEHYIQLADFSPIGMDFDFNALLDDAVEGMNAYLGNFMHRAIYACGGGLIFESVSTYTFEGESVSLLKEASTISNLLEDAGPMMDVGEGKLQEKHALALKNIVNDVADSGFLTPIVANFVSRVTDKWANGEPFEMTFQDQKASIPAPDLGENIEPSARKIYAAFRETTPQTLREDLNTLADVVYVLVVNDVFYDPGSTVTILTNMASNDVIDQVFDIIEQNQRLSVLVVEIENIALRFIGDTLGIPSDAAELYSGLLEDLSARIEDLNRFGHNADDYTNQLCSYVLDTFPRYGFAMTETMGDVLAVALAIDFRNANSVTVADLQAFFADFADSVGQKTVSMSYEDSRLLALETTDTNRSAGVYWLNEMLDALTREDPVKLEIQIVTAEQLLGGPISKISQSLLDRYTKDEKKDFNLYFSQFQSSETLDSVLITIGQLQHSPEQISESRAMVKTIVSGLKDLLKSIEDLDRGQEDTREVLRLVGGLMDDLSRNAYDRTDMFLLALLESSSVTDGLDMNPVETRSVGDMIINEVHSKNLTYEELLPSMYDVVTAMMAVTSGDDPQENIRVMLDNLTPATAQALSSIATTDLLSNLGVPEENREGTVSVVSNLMNNFADAKENGLTDEEIQRESESINALMSVSLSTSDSDSNEMFGEDSKSGMTADDFLSNVFDSTIVSQTMQDSITGEDGEVIEDPLGLGAALTDNDIQALYEAEAQGNYSEEQIQMLHTFLGIPSDQTMEP